MSVLNRFLERETYWSELINRKYLWICLIGCYQKIFIGRENNLCIKFYNPLPPIIIPTLSLKTWKESEIIIQVTKTTMWDVLLMCYSDIANKKFRFPVYAFFFLPFPDFLYFAHSISKVFNCMHFLRDFRNYFWKRALIHRTDRLLLVMSSHFGCEQSWILSLFTRI